MDDQVDALQARARARVGQVLREKWRLDRLLGVGGMAAVFAATHVNNGRRAAIKLLHTELGINTEVRTRFLREGYLANKVEHPGTVAVLDDQVCEDGTVFLVMELLDGETLEDRRERQGSLPPHEVLSLADRILDVLAAAHDKGIVHRDIKPENIFLTRDGAVKVLDFGIARMRELQATRLTLTSAGAIGTPAFMPPEQARGRWDDVGPRSDLWAVGATLFTLVAGRLVHEAETMNELMLAAMTKPAPPLASVAPGVPPPLAGLVDRALAYDINQRWVDARSMQTAARAAYQLLDRGGVVSGASGVFQAPMSRPMGAAPPPEQPTAPEGAYRPQPGHPVTIQGSARSTTIVTGRKPDFPVLAVAGGLALALLCGGGLLLLLVHNRPPIAPVPTVGAGSVSATATATTMTAQSPPDASPPPAAAPSDSAVPSASASTDAEAPKPAKVPPPPPPPQRPKAGAAWSWPKR